MPKFTTTEEKAALHKLSEEEGKIWEVINDDIGDLSIRADEIAAINRSIDLSVDNDDLTDYKMFNGLLMLIRIQKELIENLDREINIVSDKLSDIIYHRNNETTADREESPQHTTE